MFNDDCFDFSVCVWRWLLYPNLREPDSDLWPGELYSALATPFVVIPRSVSRFRNQWVKVIIIKLCSLSTLYGCRCSTDCNEWVSAVDTEMWRSVVLEFLRPSIFLPLLNLVIPTVPYSRHITDHVSLLCCGNFGIRLTWIFEEEPPLYKD